MKTDSTGFPLITESFITSRMDRSPNQTAHGSGKTDDSGSGEPLFQAFYRKIAGANRLASCSPCNEAPTASVSGWKSRSLNHAADHTADSPSAPWLADPSPWQPERATAPGHDDGSDATDSDDNAGSGSVIIRKALRTVSEALGLKIDPQLDDLSISESGESTRQMAEILSNLKNIAGILDQAAAQNQGLQTGNLKIDPGEAQKLAVLLHSQVFRIEFGTSLLGMSGPVQSDLAQKLSTSFTQGIPQASDPNALAMPASHLNNVFQQNNQENDLPALLQKIADLYGAGSAQVNGVAASENPGGSGTDAGGGAASDANLLKLLATNTGKPVDNADQQGVDGAIASAGINPAASAGASGVESTARPLASGGTDESVMNRLTERLSSAVKQGLTEINIRLRPESLGEVRVSIKVHGDVVSAHLQVESQRVQQIVQSNVHLLKDALAQQNLQPGGIEVTVGDGGQAGGRDAATAGDARADGVEAVAESGGVTDSVPVPELGQETGRRFGLNSVEYFA